MNLNHIFQTIDRRTTASRDRSLSVYLTTCLVLTVVLLSAIFITLDYYNRYHQANKQLVRNSDEYINFISNTLRFPLWDVDQKSVEHIGQAYAKNDFIERIIIKNQLNETLYLSSNSKKGETIKKRRNIVHQGYMIGFVEIDFRLNHYNKKINETFLTAIVVIFVIVLTLSISTGLFLRRILKIPLRLLIDGSERIASGDYQFRFEDLKYREIKELAAKFSHMAKQIEERESRLEDEISERKQTEEELRQYRDHLEELVSDRTRALTELNLQLQQAMAETQAMATQAEAANQAKSEFLANMSHELRTPLHVMLSCASLGRKRTNTVSADRLCTYFEKIDHSGHTLLGLVNDLLDLAKLEVGKMAFDFRPYDLRILCGMVVEEFQLLISEQDISLQYTPPTTAAMAYIDAERFMQVVRNLLSNAIKFSSAGGIITCRITQESSHLTIAIQDQGIGIPPDELEAVFDKFIQASSTKTGAGGTGLGLAISREIINAHHGRIWAENAPDAGTIFMIEIPVVSPNTTRSHPI